MRHSERCATGRFVTNNLHWRAPCTLFSRPAAINDQGRTCYKGCLVRSQVEGGIRDLIGSPHASDGLASVELLAHLVFVARKIACQVAFDKRRLYCAWTDSVAANPLRDEVDGNRARQRQHSTLTRTIGQATVNTDGGCNRGHVYDHASGR